MVAKLYAAAWTILCGALVALFAGPADGPTGPVVTVVRTSPWVVMAGLPQTSSSLGRQPATSGQLLDRAEKLITTTVPIVANVARPKHALTWRFHADGASVSVYHRYGRLLKPNAFNRDAGLVNAHWHAGKPAHYVAADIARHSVKSIPHFAAAVLAELGLTAHSRLPPVSWSCEYA